MSATAETECPNLTDSTNSPSQEMSNELSDALPGRTMTVEQRHEGSRTPREDPATVATNEKLKHTSISDKAAAIAADSEVTETKEAHEDRDMDETARASTPRASDLTDAQLDEMRERISSPKKKRGRDHDEDIKELEEENAEDPGSSADGSVINGGRASRLGPEKKRPRDGSEDRPAVGEQAIDSKDAADNAPSDTANTTSDDKESSTEEPKAAQISTFGGKTNEPPQTSASAFANSGFASLAASSTSPFGSIGATKPSVFGGGTQSTASGFGALAGTKSASSTSTTSASVFGGLAGDKPAAGFGFGGSSTSGFGSIASASVFGSALGNGFAGGSRQKLSSFAAPGTDRSSTIIGTMPVKAFGAPESDEEEGSAGDDSEGLVGTDDDTKSLAPEDKDKDKDKRKSKLSKVHVEDGESGEATLLQLRVKLFAIESKEAGWKERGVGTLKINVPESCVSYDDNGHPVPGSFDASGIEDEDEDEGSACPRVARLIMRQENTHRVILNTIIVRAMEFQDKPSTSTAQILFTAFEGEKEPKPVNMLLKMSEANAKLFKSEVESIKHEL